VEEDAPNDLPRPGSPYASLPCRAVRCPPPSRPPTRSDSRASSMLLPSPSVHHPANGITTPTNPIMLNYMALRTGPRWWIGRQSASRLSRWAAENVLVGQSVLQAGVTELIVASYLAKHAALPAVLEESQ
jgi:hypothetical protein